MSVEPAADLGCGGAGARGARLPVGIAAGCAGPLSPAAAALRTCWKCRILQPHLGPAEAETPGEAQPLGLCQPPHGSDAEIGQPLVSEAMCRFPV